MVLLRKKGIIYASLINNNIVFYYYMENYINNFYNFDKIIVYDFKLGDGGIGDYLKFFMIALTKCINNNTRIYHKINNIEIEKYIKFKYDFFNITSDEISKLKNNVTITTPYSYYNDDKYKGNIYLNEVFYFDNIVKLNVKNIFPSIPTNYISIHLRLGDKFLETDKKFVWCKNNTRKYSEKEIYKFIEDNNNKDIIFFCDNNSYKLEIKKKYKNIFITKAQVGHTSLKNTTNEQILDAITEFYILSNSQLIYAASHSGFSIMSSKFNNVEYII